jgi:hypothetical protein
MWKPLGTGNKTFGILLPIGHLIPVCFFCDECQSWGKLAVCCVTLPTKRLVMTLSNGLKIRIYTGVELRPVYLLSLVLGTRVENARHIPPLAPR